MKTRIFQTRFYDDEDVIEMNLYEQHLYFYLLTCQYINISGMFQLSPKKVKFEAKLTELQFTNASQRLEEMKKAVFYKGWVYVINARKNNNYERSEDNQKACMNELARVPLEVKEHFNTVLPTVVSTVPIIHKQEIINKKQEPINNKSKTEELRKQAHALIGKKI
jgi:hypothetical protein